MRPGLPRQPLLGHGRPVLLLPHARRQRAPAPPQPGADCAVLRLQAVALDPPLPRPAVHAVRVRVLPPAQGRVQRARLLPEVRGGAVLAALPVPVHARHCADRGGVPRVRAAHRGGRVHHHQPLGQPTRRPPRAAAAAGRHAGGRPPPLRLSQPEPRGREGGQPRAAAHHQGRRRRRGRRRGGQEGLRFHLHNRPRPPPPPPPPRPPR